MSKEFDNDDEINDDDDDEFDNLSASEILDDFEESIDKKRTKKYKFDSRRRLEQMLEDKQLDRLLKGDLDYWESDYWDSDFEDLDFRE